MRRAWIFIGLGVAVIGAIAYQRYGNWRDFKYSGARLAVDLGQPDALIRTESLSALPRDLLKMPIARAVLTEDLAFYYEQHEDRLGLNGAIKRIAYEHNLDWGDRIVQGVFNEPAQVALWRDGKGALRHYALVLKRNAMAKVLQEAATVALKDGQLSKAGEIDTDNGTATVLALTLNPRRTLLLISQGDKIVVLSDPGLLFDKNQKIVKASRLAVSGWFDHADTLALQFALDGVTPGGAAATAASATVAAKSGNAALTHTFAIGAPTLALGYGAFVPGFKGLRFDFGAGAGGLSGAWSTSVWLDPKQIAARGLGDGALWRAAPANPSACVLLPVDWKAAQTVVAKAHKKPQLPGAAGPGSASASASASAGDAANLAAMAALDGAALACWYQESNLYSPVFIARLRNKLPQRDATLQALADWAIVSGGAVQDKEGAKDDTLLWKAANNEAALGARGDYVVFSPDGTLVSKVLNTIGRSHPSVADQMPTSDATLALMTPRPLAAMAEVEMMAALGNAGEENLLAAAQTHLPARMEALAAFPPYRLEMTGKGKAGEWQPVEWRSLEKKK